MKRFCFTVDDNIRFLKEINEKKYNSIFDHPYLKMYKRLHEKYGLMVQLNLFYKMEGFDLSMMTADYIDEWKANASWLKMSFHSEYENEKPYELSEYDEVYGDCKAVNDQIIRFASSAALANTTTVHYCLLTDNGVKAMKDNGVKGLLGLFGNTEKPRSSYNISHKDAENIRNGEIIELDGMSYAGIDIILNLFDADVIISKLQGLAEHDIIKVMIHEQYFYPDYIAYQPNFEEKLDKTFAYLCGQGYKSSLFGDLIS